MEIREILENLVENTNEGLGKNNGLSVRNVRTIDKAENDIIDYLKECSGTGFDIYKLIDKTLCFFFVICGVLCAVAFTAMLLRVAFG